MATLKLKTKPAAQPTGERRAPLRPGGVKPPRPTLAQAEAERSRRRDEAPARKQPTSANPDASDTRAAPHAGSRADARTDTRAPAGPPTRRDTQRDPRTRSDPRPDARPHRDAPSQPPGRAYASSAASTSARPPTAGPSGRPRPAPGAAPAAARRPAGSAPIAPITPVPAPRQPAASTQPAGDPDHPRLAKRLTELGLASRREADEWIAQGLVRVDGVVVDTLGSRVRREQSIEIDPLARQQQAERVTVLLNKPLGYVSGQAEDGHRPAYTLVNATSRWAGDHAAQRFHPGQLKHLVPAGRLDLDSSGLLVLTQDGRIAKQLIGEDSTVEKEYLVQVAWIGHPEAQALNHDFPAAGLAKLRHGLKLDGVALKPAQVSWQNERHLRFVLREGRKRQIRRMCELVGLQVLSLKRLRIGRVTLGELPPGQWRYLGLFEQF